VNWRVRIGSWRGAPIFAHWTLPLLAIVLSDFRFKPILWSGIAVIMLVHELGHAIAVRACGASTVEIEFNAVGGHCLWSGRTSALQHSAIAWGGVAGQGALLCAVLVVTAFAPVPRFSRLAEFVDVLIGTNIYLMIFNLLPWGPLDGSHAWPLVPRVLERAVYSWREKSQHAGKAVNREVDALDAAEQRPIQVPEVDAFLRSLTSPPEEKQG